jgi:hypothetical protein
MMRKPATAIAEKTAPMRYPCAAQGCAMPGALFPTGASGGLCVYHYDAGAHEWPRITRVLRDWKCVTDIINEAKRLHSDVKTCMDVRLQNEKFADAWEHLQELAPAWVDSLAPRPTKAGFPETYREWTNRLEYFLVKQLSPRREK